jgi:hypothetical protein
MKERPIIFSGEMVRAILDGRKTQTRRVINPQPESETIYGPLFYEPAIVDKYGYLDAGEPIFGIHDDNDYGVKFPYGQIGDRLWAREKWRIIGWDPENGDWKIEYSDGSWKWFENTENLSENLEEDYWQQSTDDCIKADIPQDESDFFQFDDDHPCPTRWRSSIFMPRCFSRITLEIVNVRVERVQDISEADIIAEGCPNEYLLGRNWYQPLWDSINAKRGYGWDANPLVWVIEFKVLP